MRKNFIRSLILAISISSLSIPHVQAQEPANVEPHGFSLGFKFGLSDMWGDVGTETVLDHYTNNKYWDLPHFMGGIFFRYSFHPALAARLNFNYGTIFATDEWNVQKAKQATTIQNDFVQRYARFLDTKDNMWEGSLTFEISPLRLGSPASHTSRMKGQPYILAGIGYFHFQPYALYTDPETKVTQYVKTYNLHLEGDGWNIPDAPARYSLWQMEIPLGLGYKFDLGEHLNVGVEWEWRMTMFDYLDGVSNKYIDPKYFDQNLPAQQAYIAKAMYDRSRWGDVNKAGNAPGTMRGNPSNNDSYSTISIVVYWKTKTRTTNWWE